MITVSLFRDAVSAYGGRMGRGFNSPTIMACYGFCVFFHPNQDGQEASDRERKLSAKTSNGMASVFSSVIGLLVLLNLAGDATEVLTILFVARFGDVFFVFIAAVVALIAATAVETMIGNRLSGSLSANRIRIFSLLVLLITGTIAIFSVVLQA